MCFVHTRFFQKVMRSILRELQWLVHAKIIIIRVQAIIFCTKFYAIDFVNFVPYIGL